MSGKRKDENYKHRKRAGYCLNLEECRIKITTKQRSILDLNSLTKYYTDGMSEFAIINRRC